MADRILRGWDEIAACLDYSKSYIIQNYRASMERDGVIWYKRIGFGPGKVGRGVRARESVLLEWWREEQARKG